MIPDYNCCQGGIYDVDARNFSVAVYAGETKFIGIRFKFGNTFLDTEYHYDTGFPYGTVTPMERIGTVPPDIWPLTDSNDRLFEFLVEFVERRNSSESY